MTEYRYILQRADSSCVYLSESGPQEKPKEFLADLRHEGFVFAEEKHFGDAMLRVMTREFGGSTTGGARVHTDPYSGRKTLS